MPKEIIPRIDLDNELKNKLLPFCRLKYGEIWEDKISGHKVGCLDISKIEDVKKIMAGKKAVLSLQDPPYNIKVGKNKSKNLNKMPLNEYINWCRIWVSNILTVLNKDAHFYVWLGADQQENFQPLPDFIILLREFPELKSRSFITMRNQRGYGTQKNWMAIRQELLYYIKGNPSFNVEAEYTDIPKILQGYYKVINGNLTSNLERSKSTTIRAGNVWVDIQQVFFLMHENVPGCYAQKPIKAIQRIITASTKKNDIVIDFFSHSGSTLLASEILNRRCYTFDIDPIFSEITIRRLERYRKTKELGWQISSPFPEIF
ncbi:MAG TPA: site-specific DNA-methyltransferase [Ignavibacteria bacterium]